MRRLTLLTQIPSTGSPNNYRLGTVDLELKGRSMMDKHMLKSYVCVSGRVEGVDSSMLLVYIGIGILIDKILIRFVFVYIIAGAKHLHVIVWNLWPGK